MELASKILMGDMEAVAHLFRCGFPAFFSIKLPLQDKIPRYLTFATQLLTLSTTFETEVKDNSRCRKLSR